MKKKFLKSALCATLVCATMATTAVGLTACNPDSEENVQIAIGVQQTSGNNFESMCNLLDSLKEELNFSYSTILMTRNNDENLTAFDNAMLSGAAGIISMTDMDVVSTKTLIEKCEVNNAYYAGYMSDFANTFANKNAGDVANVNYIKSSPHMLGAVSDGEIDGAVRGEFLFNQVVATTARKVTFARFPLYAYPSAATSINKFKELATTYNQTHDDDFEFIVNAGDGATDTFEVNFSMASVPDATVQDWNSKGVEAVIAVNSLGKKILTPANTYAPNLAIYQTGWDDNIVSSFPDKIKTLCQTPAETIIYPLVRILNAVRGNSYADEPTDKGQTIVTGQYVYLTTTQDLENGRRNSMNFSLDHTVEHSLVTPAQVKALLAGEEGASFAKLKGTLDSWTTKYALTRQH